MNYTGAAGDPGRAFFMRGPRSIGRGASWRVPLSRTAIPRTRRGIAERKKMLRPRTVQRFRRIAPSPANASTAAAPGAGTMWIVAIRSPGPNRDEIVPPSAVLVPMKLSR